MASMTVTKSPLASKAAAANLSRSTHQLLYGSSTSLLGPCFISVTYKSHDLPFRRNFSSTPRTQLKDIFPPPKNAPNIKLTGPAWHHPVFTEAQMNAIGPAHREPQSFSDRIALAFVKLLRFGMDTATFYKHDKAVENAVKDDPNSAAKKRSWFAMTERKWLIRMVFLESVAGVPGMVGGMVRHLHSLRRLKRDNGWIETLLEEAYNERMHLLTFMKMAQPGLFMQTMILLAQGVFFNSLFVSYLISPRTVHRFVGYLEEEAVHTYTLAIQDIDRGLLPKWASQAQLKALPEASSATPDSSVANQVPEIAIRYWNMPEGHRTMRDLLLYVRADEAKHREVNHTLGSLDQKDDPNPFVSEYKNDKMPHPGKGIENIRPTGWERKEVV